LARHTRNNPFSELVFCDNNARRLLYVRTTTIPTANMAMKVDDMEDVKPTGLSMANGASDAPTDSSSVHARPTVADLHGENHFAQVARKNWLSAKKTPKVRPEVVKKELWDELENVDFAYSSLLILENLQLLERYLWPGFTDEASNYHVLLVALMVNVKRRENLTSWGECMRFLVIDNTC
jgi:intron-binding protein aquarius